MEAWIDTRTEREVMMDKLSDLSKDVYGFRWRYDYPNMSAADMQNEYARLCVELELVMAAEKVEQDNAGLEYEVEVMGLMSSHKISRKDAIRWMMQAQNFNEAEMYSEKENFDNFLYNQGLSSKKINEELEKIGCKTEINWGY